MQDTSASILSILKSHGLFMPDLSVRVDLICSGSIRMKTRLLSLGMAEAPHSAKLPHFSQAGSTSTQPQLRSCFDTMSWFVLVCTTANVSVGQGSKKR